MDAIKKKMSSLKTETDNLYGQIHAYEEETKNYNEIANGCDGEIRDISKRIGLLETDCDSTNDKLVSTTNKLEETEKNLKSTEEDVNAMTRRQALMEDEVRKAEISLASAVTDLAITSRKADSILKQVK